MNTYTIKFNDTFTLSQSLEVLAVKQYSYNLVEFILNTVENKQTSDINIYIRDSVVDIGVYPNTNAFWPVASVSRLCFVFITLQRLYTSSSTDVISLILFCILRLSSYATLLHFNFISYKSEIEHLKIGEKEEPKRKEEEK